MALFDEIPLDALRNRRNFMRRASPAPQTSVPDDSSVTDWRTHNRRQWIFLARVVALVVLVVLGYKILRAGLYGLDAYNSGLKVLELRKDGDLDTQEIVQAQAPVAEIARSVSAMEYEMRFFAPALRAVRLVPGPGESLAAVPALLTTAREMTLLARDMLSLMPPTAQARPQASVMELTLATIAADPESFVQLAERAATAEKALSPVRTDRMLAIAGDPTAQIHSAVRLLASGLRMAPILPNLFGLDRPKNYLLLVQNNHELRATGGFISAIGLMTIDKGRIGEITFADSYDIARSDVDHPRAPDPMQRYMDIELIFARDANWSPDLPTSAQLVRALYTQDTGVQVDGVMTIDLRAVELLVDALAPLEVPGASEPITGDNFLEQIVQFWNKPLESGDTIESAGLAEWWEQRKDFMPALAEAALSRLKGGGVNYLALAHAIDRALDERAIQVWFADQIAASEMARVGWDGGVEPIQGRDFLALVDTNMGYNKVDAVLRRSLDYSVAWPDGPDEPGLAIARVTYEHPRVVPGHVCDPTPRYGSDYDDMIDRCYFDYVRLYTPGGSELISVEGVEEDSISSARGENNTQVFAGYFILPPGTQHTVTFTYRLPPAIQADDYQLVVRRQSGAGPLAFQATVNGEHVEAIITGGTWIWPELEPVE